MIIAVDIDPKLIKTPNKAITAPCVMSLESNEDDVIGDVRNRKCSMLTIEQTMTPQLAIFNRSFMLVDCIGSKLGEDLAMWLVDKGVKEFIAATISEDFSPSPAEVEDFTARFTQLGIETKVAIRPLKESNTPESLGVDLSTGLGGVIYGNRTMKVSI